MALIWDALGFFGYCWGIHDLCGDDGACAAQFPPKSAFLINQKMQSPTSRDRRLLNHGQSIALIHWIHWLMYIAHQLFVDDQPDPLTRFKVHTWKTSFHICSSTLSAAFVMNRGEWWRYSVVASEISQCAKAKSPIEQLKVKVIGRTNIDRS